MQVRAGEVAVLSWQAQRLERDRRRVASFRDGDASLCNRVVEPARNLQLHVANRQHQRAFAWTEEVVVFERLKTPIKAVVGMHPGIIGRIGTAVGSKHTHSRWHSLAMLVAHTQLELADLLSVMPLPRVDANSRAANDLLDPERRIALFVTDVANVVSIGRKWCLGTIEPC